MPIDERVLKALRAVTDSDPGVVDPNTPLQTIEGWDSMRAVNFQLELEQEFGVDLSGAEISGNSTLADVMAALRRSNAGV